MWVLYIFDESQQSFVRARDPLTGKYILNADPDNLSTIDSKLRAQGSRTTIQYETPRKGRK